LLLVAVEVEHHWGHMVVLAAAVQVDSVQQQACR
jgi:hypothetical protein